VGLSEIGVKFGLPGVDQSITQMSRLRSGFMDLQRTVDSAVGRMDARTNAISGSVHRMSTNVSRSLNLAKAAFGAFVTGKAIGGVADWMRGDPAAQQWTDYLRRYGASEEAIKQYDAHMTALRKTMPGISRAEYSKGVFDVQSKLGADAVEANKRAMESAILLAKGLGPEATIDEATNLMRKFMWSYGVGKSNEDLVPMIEKFAAQIPKALSMSGAQGKDLKVALGHLVGIYSQMGKPQEDMIADMATLAGAMGERTGELLRAVMSKQGEGFSKIAASVAKERVLSQMGARTEFDLSEDQRGLLKKSLEVTKANAQRWAGLTLSRDPAKYMKQLDDYMNELTAQAKTRGTDVANILQEAFSEGAAQGLPIITKAFVSGERGALGKALKEVSPAEEMKATLESYKSFDAQYGIFKQKAEDLSKTMKKPFQALAMELMRPYGTAIDDIESNWNQKTDLMSQNVISFARSTGAGFLATFGPLPSIDAMLKSIVETLGDPDPTKWQQLGEEFGRWAGTNLKPLTADIASIASSISTIASIVPNLKTLWDWTGGWAVEGYRKFQQDLLPDMQTGGAAAFESARRPFTVNRAPAPAESLAGPIALGPTGQWLVDAVRSAINAVMPTAATPAVNVESKPTLNVRIGDREIKDVAVEAVKEEMKANYAASRRGAFERGM